MAHNAPLDLFNIDKPTKFIENFNQIISKDGVMIDFDWDYGKAKTNLRKHRVAFSEAATVFKDRWTITTYDPDHSNQEDRYLTIGTSEPGRLLMIAHTDRGDRTRIISARELTRKEREAYEKEIQRRNP
jgi:uncharacterized DUF497 family protein